MKVLGIDPGYGRLGWAIVEGDRSKQSLIKYGCLETSPQDSINVRLEEIYDHTVDLIQEHKPDGVAVEELYFSKNVKTAIDVSQARGVILLAVVKQKIDCFNYNPMEIKNTVVGYGKASKQQMQMMIKSQLHLKSVPKPDDAADACAVALTHIFCYR